MSAARPTGTAPDARDVARTLVERRPQVHHDGSREWGAHAGLLDLLVELAPPGGTTAETGAGYSTVVLLARSARHVAVAPAPDEFASLRRLCADLGVDTSGLTAVEEPSQTALPGCLPEQPLDLALVDGGHGFPLPFVDFCHLGDALARGGVLVVDDCQLRAGRVLRGFLRADTPRWEHVTDRGRTSAFRKTVDGPVSGTGHWQQPWQARRSYPVAGDGVRGWSDAARSAVRLRSRLRALRG